MLDLLQIRRRRNFFDESGVLPVKGQVRCACPCCGYPTLRGRGGYEICELCWWEDDGQDDENADEVPGGPNAEYSLNHARENFQLFGVMYSPAEDRRIGGADSEAERAIKEKIVNLFEAMMTTASLEQHRAMWQETLLLERQLDREVKRRSNS